MFDLGLRRRLRRLLGGPARLRPEHARALEAQLLERFDRVYPEMKAYKMKRFTLKKVLVACAAAALAFAAACAAPTDMEVEVGRSITIRGVDEAALPAPDAVAEMIGGDKGAKRMVSFQVEQDQGGLTAHLQIFGAPPPDGSLADRLREKFPALASAEIREEAIEGTVRGTLGAKLGHTLLDLDVIDEEDEEAIRQQVLEHLAAQGVEGEVDVKAHTEGGRRKVEVRVQRADCPPDEPAPAASPPP